MLMFMTAKWAEAAAINAMMTYACFYGGFGQMVAGVFEVSMLYAPMGGSAGFVACLAPRSQKTGVTSLVTPTARASHVLEKCLSMPGAGLDVLVRCLSSIAAECVGGTVSQC